MEANTDAETSHGRVRLMHIDVVGCAHGIHRKARNSRSMVWLGLPEIADTHHAITDRLNLQHHASSVKHQYPSVTLETYSYKPHMGT